jgi:large subunit ribosomal protein L18
MKSLLKRKIKRKTDYKKRLGMLKSGMGRVVIRKSNKYITIQYVKSEEAKDNIITGANSKELLKYGWSKDNIGSLKSIAAAYLTGYLAGKKIKEKEKKCEAITDIGINRGISGSRIFSALKGVIDAGIKINANESIFPDEKKLNGKGINDLSKIVQKVKENIK